MHTNISSPIAIIIDVTVYKNNTSNATNNIIGLWYKQYMTHWAIMSTNIIKPYRIDILLIYLTMMYLCLIHTLIILLYIYFFMAGACINTNFFNREMPFLNNSKQTRDANSINANFVINNNWNNQQTCLTSRKCHWRLEKLNNDFLYYLVIVWKRSSLYKVPLIIIITNINLDYLR